MVIINELINAGKIFEKDSKDKYSRYKSWEFCYQKFQESEYDRDELTINLSLYLASWGMYRGSTFLINKNYKINTGIVDIIKEFQKEHSAHNKILNKEQLEELIKNDEYFNDIEKLGNKIAEYYYKEIQDKNVTDTLKTKIIMGTIGITPAYDTYFKESLKDLDEHILKSFKAKSIKQCYEYYNKYYYEFEEIRKNKFEGYPIMKILDMCLWQYQKNKKDAEK